MTPEPNTDSDSSIDTSTVSRRAMLTGVAGLGAMGMFASTASAEASGEVGADEPYIRAYMDRKVFVGRTTDPSSPADGTEWYREDL